MGIQGGSVSLWFSPEDLRHQWQPPVDIYRTPSGWVLKFDLAGVRADELSVVAEGSRIRVRGSRRDRLVERGWSHHSIEISYSQFERTVNVPCDADTMSMSTEYVDGMLLVKLEATTRSG